MKIVLAILTTFFALNVNAGEFSKIDQEVRETIIMTFDVDWEGNRLGRIDYTQDIWNLEVSGANTQDCLIEVTAYFNKPGQWGDNPSVAWICINRGQSGEYEGEVLDHDDL